MAAIADGDYLFDTILANHREAAEGNGVISGMVVIETATPDKTVTVGTGSYIADGTKVTKGTTTSVDLTTHINGSNPNKVIITADSAGSITATAATAAAANPVGSTGPQTKVPLLPNLPANEILLAEVWLATAETTILNADITNHIITVPDSTYNPENVFTTRGDVIYRNATVPARLAIGGAGNVFKTNGTDPSWGALTRSIWIMPFNATGTGVTFPSSINSWPSAKTADAQTNIVYFAIPIPSDFLVLTKAVLVYISSGTGNIYRSVATSFAANGQSEATHTDSIASAAVAVTAIYIDEDDISAAFTGILANDYVSVRLTRDGANALDTTTAALDVIGLLINYT